MELEAKIKQVEERPSYGHINVCSETLPAVKNLKVGQEVMLTVKARVTSLRAPDRWEISEKKKHPDTVLCSLEIHSVGSNKKKSK